MDGYTPKGPERRQFIRVRAELELAFKFLSRSLDLGTEGEQVYRGRTQDLSAGGMLLVGPVPIPEWIPSLLAHHVAIGLNLFLPNRAEPVKVLARVVWIEGADEEDYLMGLEFRELVQESRDAITRFIIHSHLPG